VQSAYQAVDKIHFDGAHFRKDIAARALKHD
jgi:phosphoribosylamine-glycine ligase